ncbi:MAG: protein kinase [Acidobacteria bacterium]|nr:protein kinase [Acidobacteriota bacterium]
MGSVYRATDTKLGRDVAIKVLPDAYAGDADRLGRFTREAQVLAALNHPNIATIFGIEERAIVMELVEGPTLADRIAGGALGAEEALRIAKQIAEALEAAHERGVVHRDLKPANVKVTADGKVKVLDFGLAKLADPTDAGEDPASAPTVMRGNSPTMSGMIMGTVGYMAPEQARGHRVDKRADIWAFGVVLYEMLTGRHLFDTGSVAQSIADVLRADIDLNELPEGVQAGVRTLLGRCLDRNVKTRLRDIGEARILLDAPPAPSTPAGVATPRVSRGIWPWAALVFAAGVPLVWFLKPAREAPLLQVDIVPPSGLSLGPARHGQLRISPDGTRIVFTARNTEGKRSLYLRSLESGSTVPLPGTNNGMYAVWSPDSRQIAFHADGVLKRLDLDDNRATDLFATGTGTYAIWHTDGNLYFTSPEFVLMKVAATGGVPKTVLPQEQAATMRMSTPSSIPGQDSILCQIQGPPTKIVQLSTNGVILRTILPQNSWSGAPAAFAVNPAGGGWLLHNMAGQNGQLGAIAMNPRTGALRGEEVYIAQQLPAGPAWSTSNTGVLAYRKYEWTQERRLTWVERNGTTGETLTKDGMNYAPRFSPDQKRMAFTRDAGSSTAIYIQDLARQTTTRLPGDYRRGSIPEWTPDGESIIYVSERTKLMQQRVDGWSPAKPLGPAAPYPSPTGVSPDGKWLLSSLSTVGVSRMVITSLATGERILYGEKTKLFSHNATFSPDGRWLLYSALVNGQWDVFLRPVPSEISGKDKAADFVELQVTTTGGAQPKWRADGKEIFYVSMSGMMMAVPVEAAGSTLRFGGHAALFPTSLTTENIFQREYDVTADGRRFVLPLSAAGMQTEVPITVVFNYPRMLTKR